MIVGLSGSYAHNQNGMILSDMSACQAVADRLNEVIVFRSTGPWAKRWIERGYPTKNFHVKGKSSDWGPHAGLVPFDGTWSKVGYDAGKAAAGTAENVKGLNSGFASRAVLRLDRAQIDEALQRKEGKPARTAIENLQDAPGGKDLLLSARRSGDQLLVHFLAQAGSDGLYTLYVIPPRAGAAGNLFILADKLRSGGPQAVGAAPLEVMVSMEEGAGRAITGDYDLMMICPTWAAFNELTLKPIAKEGIQLTNAQGQASPALMQAGLQFGAGARMDTVLDHRLATGGVRGADWNVRNAAYAASQRQGVRSAATTDMLAREQVSAANPLREHADMGNLTPRILRCINELNVAMGAVGPKAALRRVHHNAESHRYIKFGALTQTDMTTVKPGEAYGDGFPLTVFQPARLMSDRNVGRYGQVCTLETLQEFRSYMEALYQAGYYVPRSWVWNHVKT